MIGRNGKALGIPSAIEIKILCCTAAPRLRILTIEPRKIQVECCHLSPSTLPGLRKLDHIALKA
jgi:hypothetical protein